MKKVIPCFLMLLFAFSAQHIFSQSLKIAVFSDPHYFDTALLINDGTAFQYYIASDRKLIAESYAILEATIDTLIAISPDILLIPGDLTKDGSYSSHSHFALKLQEVENAGIKVFVAAGNHDINNPYSRAYDGAAIIQVPAVSPTQFDSIYQSFGFAEAIAKDTSSLSYLAEPYPGFQILSLDACIYDSNYAQGYPTTSGKFKASTFQWALDRITDAKNSGKRIFGMMHHGAVEHFFGQSILFPEYVVYDWDSIYVDFADAGLEVMFTGHFHSQDIVQKTTAMGNTIYDIETGSLLTWPCPFRILELTGNQLNVEGGVVENIDYDTDSLSFQDYAYAFLTNGMPLIIKTMLMQPPYSLSDTTASLLEPAITISIIEHYGGDEANPPLDVQIAIAFLMMDPQTAFLGQILDSIWHDPQPSDWVTSIPLSTLTGEVQQVETANILIYPNPAREYVQIEFAEMDGQAEVVSLELYNVNGQLVYEQILPKGKRELMLHLAAYTPGLYTLQFRTNESRFLTKKLHVLK